VELAAQGNFVIVLYNPKSRKRRRQLAEAVNIIGCHRPPETPAGIVTNAYRSGQNVVITDIRHLAEQDVGMNSIVIIGNDETFVANGRMVTPRGYHTKYSLAEVL
jgi:precorrin-3B C17-methyltransferase